jgi:hypothetical protein
MRVATLVLALLAGLLSASTVAQASNRPQTYLKREAENILSQGDRIKQEAARMRSEGKRLNDEAAALRTAAATLDDQWTTATKLAPEKYQEYSGRDRSQIIMRSDAEREDRDADSLRIEGKRLDVEAERLWKLAADVDPRIQNSLFERMKAAGACCKSSSIEPFRLEILKQAHALGVNYVPHN